MRYPWQEISSFESFHTILEFDNCSTPKYLSIVLAIVTSHLDNCSSLLTDSPSFPTQPPIIQSFPWNWVTLLKFPVSLQSKPSKALFNAYGTLHDLAPCSLLSPLPYLNCSSHTHLLYEWFTLSSFTWNVPHTSNCMDGSLCFFRYLFQCYLIRQVFHISLYKNSTLTIVPYSLALIQDSP